MKHNPNHGLWPARKGFGGAAANHNLTVKPNCYGEVIIGVQAPNRWFECARLDRHQAALIAERLEASASTVYPNDRRQIQFNDGRATFITTSGTLEGWEIPSLTQEDLAAVIRAASVVAVALDAARLEEEDARLTAAGR